MDTQEVRKYLHDLNNALNAAKIHAFLLRQENHEPQQLETLTGLDTALESARKLVGEMYQKLVGT